MKQVQKRLTEARPSNLSTLQTEILTLRVDLIVSLAALVTFAGETSLVSVLNLFTLDEPINSSLRKRPCMNEDSMTNMYM